MITVLNIGMQFGAEVRECTVICGEFLHISLIVYLPTLTILERSMFPHLCEGCLSESNCDTLLIRVIHVTNNYYI